MIRARRWGVGVAVALAIAMMQGCSGGAPPPPLPLTGTVAVGANLNPDRDGRPSPVFVRVYQLESRDAFQSAAYDDLERRDQEVLGADMLHKEVLQFCPSEAGTATAGAAICRGSKDRLAQELKPGARFLAVFAEFFDSRNPKGAWRASVELPQPDDPVFGGPRMRDFKVSLSGSSVSLAFE
ncbi:MAG TPA: type VI secretion system lipoprotein TssJ [Candidatus Binatia bacterium]|nr:type VI secretion system lipoprotein TssJ [Candidatus Binatia bacterium]